MTLCATARRPLCRVFILSLLLSGCARPATNPEPFSKSLWRAAARQQKGPIALDPGHGGRDPGANSNCTKGRLIEKKLNLATALALQTKLARKRLPTLLLRQRDVFVPLDERVRRANASHAILMASLHYNWAKSRSARGIEIFYPSEIYGKERSELSRALAQTVLAEMTSQGLNTCRGVKPSAFKVLREANMPAILIEAGFLSHRGEIRYLASDAYRARVAAGIANGVERFLKISTNSNVHSPLHPRRKVAKGP